MADLAGLPSFQEYANQVQGTVDKNNAWSAAQAQKQMDFQYKMSSTAHQREVADLKAAGLNPVLSASGAGASTPTGAQADGDQSANSALTSYLANLVNSLVSIENTRVTAEATRASAAMHANASVQAAQIAAAASRYSSDNSLTASRYSSDMNYKSAKEVQGMKAEQEKYMAQTYPNNPYQATGAVIHGLATSSQGMKLIDWMNRKSIRVPTSLAGWMSLLSNAIRQNLFPGYRLTTLWSELKPLIIGAAGSGRR